MEVICATIHQDGYSGGKCGPPNGVCKGAAAEADQSRYDCHTEWESTIYRNKVLFVSLELRVDVRMTWDVCICILGNSSNIIYTYIIYWSYDINDLWHMSAPGSISWIRNEGAAAFWGLKHVETYRDSKVRVK